MAGSMAEHWVVHSVALTDCSWAAPWVVNWAVRKADWMVVSMEHSLVDQTAASMAAMWGWQWGAAQAGTKAAQWVALLVESTVVWRAGSKVVMSEGSWVESKAASTVLHSAVSWVAH